MASEPHEGNFVVTSQKPTVSGGTPLEYQSKNLSLFWANDYFRVAIIVKEKPLPTFSIVTAAKYGRRQNTDGADVFFTLNS